MRFSNEANRTKVYLFPLLVVSQLRITKYKVRNMFFHILVEKVKKDKREIYVSTKLIVGIEYILS